MCLSRVMLLPCRTVEVSVRCSWFRRQALDPAFRLPRVILSELKAVTVRMKRYTEQCPSPVRPARPVELGVGGIWRVDAREMTSLEGDEVERPM